MGISNKSRKLLWGQSGMLCAMCKTKLVFDKTTKDNEAIVGDEAHIVSASKNGPRGGEAVIGNHDDYANLILLCKIHHKLIDDQPETFTKSVLLDLKKNHEEWVRTRLLTPNSKPKPCLERVTTGKELFSYVLGTYGYHLDYDESDTEKEKEIVSFFIAILGEMLEYSIYQDLNDGQRIEINEEYTNHIKLLEENGFWVFATRDDSPIIYEGKKMSWSNVIVKVLKKDNSEIVAIEQLFKDILSEEKSGNLKDKEE